MGNILKSIGKFLLGTFLFMVSIITIILAIPWGIIEILISLFWKRSFLKGLYAFGEIILLMATLIDVMGNVILQVPFNRILIKPDSYKFGSRFDTISYVLGNAYVYGNLTKTGSFLCSFLDMLDKDHCINAYLKKT